ncbi:M48 family metallopeptidase [Alkalicella caledoniensis]|uniref:M48 family metallopeptidase n=1 Tax=Alkalicella caledoniensis TaxID=2731377 RepID=A0A7G9W7L7_ALKCA|nr:M48 family metallopeptidase [Alkalicella caledoniensis]
MIGDCTVRIKFGNDYIVFDVQYGKGKKSTIEIDAVGHITVKVPKGTSEEIIKKNVEANGKIILERLGRVSQIREMSKDKKYTEQGKFPYLGKEYSLNELIETNGISNELIPDIVKKFYIKNCKRIINERIKIYQKHLRVEPKSVKIVESNSQWGSCTWDKKIEFNYRLIMAPIDVIDYVIVHELCHLVHMNHDRSFWRLVGSVVPDYKEKQAYLGRFGGYMSL